MIGRHPHCEVRAGTRVWPGLPQNCQWDCVPCWMQVAPWAVLPLLERLPCCERGVWALGMDCDDAGHLHRRRGGRWGMGWMGWMGWMGLTKKEHDGRGGRRILRVSARLVQQQKQLNGEKSTGDMRPLLSVVPPVNCRERLALRLGLSSSSEDPLPPPLPPLVCRPNSASRAPGTRSSSRSQYAASLAFTDNTRASCFKEAGDCTGEPGALGAGDRPVLGDLRPLAVGPGLCPRDDAWPCRLDRWGAADTGRDVVPLLAPRLVVGPGLGGKGVRSVAPPAPSSPPPLLRDFLAPPPSSSRSLRGLPPPGRRTGRLRREDWGRDDVGLEVAVAVGAPDGVLG